MKNDFYFENENAENTPPDLFENETENKDVEINFSEENNEVVENELLELQIPRIKLYRKVYNIGSNLNNVDYNVEILEESDLESNLFYFVSHSGSGRASYFDNLIYLEKGDFILVNGIYKKYSFVVDEIFYIQKDGYFIDNYNNLDNTLFLITCSLDYISRQLVIRAKMVC